MAPKSNPKEVIESCLAVLDLIKAKRAPDGVLLDRTKVCFSAYLHTYQLYDLIKLISRSFFLLLPKRNNSVKKLLKKCIFSRLNNFHFNNRS